MENLSEHEATMDDVQMGLDSLKRIADGIGKIGDEEMDPWLESVKTMENDVAKINQEFIEMYNANDPSRRNNFNRNLTESVKAMSTLKEMAVELFLKDIPKDKLKRFSREDLNIFKSQPLDRIGSGSYGKVYRGHFANKVQVAIKELKPNSATEEIFIIEVRSMLKASHPNIVKLYGFCSDSNMKALVYEFLEKGSLDVVLLHNPDSVEWQAVYGVTIKIAKALAYLHNDCGDNADQIIHHDVKPSNVLLDRHLSPKVTDFGTTRIMNKNVTHFTMTRVIGSCGYTAPEMTIYSSKVTCKCDVFSFGMILFDVLGMRNTTENQHFFPNEVWDNLVKGQLDETIKECNIREEDWERAKILSKVALWCIQFTPERRPSMSDVVKALKKKMHVPRPPNPFLRCDDHYSMQQPQDVPYPIFYPSTDASDLTEPKPKSFTYANLNALTSNFSHPIGSNRNGMVFKGQFPSGVQIVVKTITEENVVESVFMTEINTMFEMSHRNLVKLYGYCFESEMKALVFRYMTNGSLDSILNSEHHGNLEWEKLYEIATETAKGISYLHNGCENQLLHGDLKPSNVLLDSNMCPKVTNFGVSKLMSRDNTHLIRSKFDGDLSYAVPEMILQSGITDKCDVYSFGMMLFKILGRRKNNVIRRIYFPKVIWNKYEKQEIEEIMKECGIMDKNREKVMILCMVAFWCIQYTPENRPSMSVVVRMLEKQIKVMKPPNPFQLSWAGKSFVDVVYDPSDLGAY